MRRQRSLIFVLLLAGCGGKEALHKGKTAAQWSKSLHDPDVQVLGVQPMSTGIWYATHWKRIEERLRRTVSPE